MPQMNKEENLFSEITHSDGWNIADSHRRQWKNITLQMKESISLPEVRLPVASASPGKAFASVKLGHILDDTPPLLDYSAGSGEFIKYKGILLLGRDFTGGKFFLRRK